MKRQRKIESMPAEPITVKKITGGGGPGPSMKVPGDGGVATPINHDWRPHSAAKAADDLGKIFGGGAKPERIDSTTKPKF